MLKVVDGEKSKFTKNEQGLYNTVKAYAQSIKEIEESSPAAKFKAAKCRIVLAYNLFKLNLPLEAIDVVNEIPEGYYKFHFESDIDFAIAAKNQATLFGRMKDIHEAEFILCAMGAVSFLLDCGLEFKNKEEFLEVAEIINKKPITVMVKKEEYENMKKVVEELDKEENENNDEKL